MVQEMITDRLVEEVNILCKNLCCGSSVGVDWSDARKDRNVEHGVRALHVCDVGEHDAKMSVVTAISSRIDLTGVGV